MTSHHDLTPIARDSGALAMVAMDQRESLRHMFDLAGAGRPADEVLVEFKLAVAERLGARASGFLIDRHLGFEQVRARSLLPPRSGLILAVDGLGTVALRVETRYPEEGTVRVLVEEAPAGRWDLGLRVPGWASGARLEEGGAVRDVEPGLVRVPGPSAGEEVLLTLPVAPRWTWPHPQIDDLRGQIAVERGPLVLCLESVDLGAGVDEARVLVDEEPIDDPGGVQVCVATVATERSAWPYGARTAPQPEQPRRVPLVPYHRWSNRGPSTMRVWVPVLEG